MSFEQLHKKKQPGATSTSAPPKAAAFPKNLPEKPPSQAPKTNVQDLKKFVHSDKKPEVAKAADSKKGIEPKIGSLKPKGVPEVKGKEKEKEKPTSHEASHLAQQKMGRKGKDIEEK